MARIRRAIISVSDKNGITELAQKLEEFGVEIISTGGTAKHLHQNGISTRSISDVTGFPEILGGRVKTLHPKVFGGLLSLRSDVSQMAEVKKHDIDLIDMVVVDLYPFEATIVQNGVALEDAAENIDIGGPCMIRAAAKNFSDVCVVISPAQYGRVIQELDQNDGQVTLATRQEFAVEAFARTAEYDAIISSYFASRFREDTLFPESMVLHLRKIQDLRYGENPHQKAAFYRPGGPAKGLAKVRQLHGKELSYNNIIDLDGAIAAVRDFSEPCVAIVKHTNPCGVAIGSTPHEAYQRALATDPVSSFGGIVALNRPVDAAVAEAIAKVFTEVVVAPSFEPAALSLLRNKKNLRLIQSSEIGVRPSESDLKHVAGGILVQDQDLLGIRDIDFKVVSSRQPTEQEWQALKFGWRVVKCVKSNAIVYCASDRTIGIGAGQMSRVDSSRIAVEKARLMGLEIKGTVVASDAFFPFRDGVDEAAKAGATALIQPGGSVRDEEVIKAVDEHSMTMVFTGVRHFRH
jgi:phosphoribosylaminoimidazolecarboxamide formyltransferase/IMP cyclohydrolase